MSNLPYDATILLKLCKRQKGAVKMIENSITRSLLDKYLTHEISKNELITETKRIFHKNLVDNQYSIEFIEEYYFMTEILDLNDCSTQECDNYVRHYIDIYNGKESCRSTISILLHKEHWSEEALDTFFLMEKFMAGFDISLSEKNRIKNFLEEVSKKNDTIYDYAIDQLKNIFQWGFDFDDVLLFEPKSILYVYNEIDLKLDAFEKMRSIIASLLGNKPIWITCIYEKGKCNLQVVI